MHWTTEQYFTVLLFIMPYTEMMVSVAVEIIATR